MCATVYEASPRVSNHHVSRRGTVCGISGRRDDRRKGPGRLGAPLESQGDMSGNKGITSRGWVSCIYQVSPASICSDRSVVMTGLVVVGGDRSLSCSVGDPQRQWGFQYNPAVQGTLTGPPVWSPCGDGLMNCYTSVPGHFQSCSLDPLPLMHCVKWCSMSFGE